MKKLTKMIMIIVAGAICLSYTVNAQVGINKDGSNPNSSSILHVKGDAVNNNVILEPGANGNVGIGTETPTTTLDVEGSFKVKDGTEGYNRVLVSDSDGKSSWKKITDVSSGLISPSFPNGLDGIIPKTIAVNSSSTYQVPNKVNFYILNVYSNNVNSLQIDGLPLTYGEFNYKSGTNTVAQLNQPILVGMGSVISGSDANDIIINGYLVGNGTGGGNPEWNCGELLVHDHDGQDYKTVQIGSQCWMAENLNIGTMINGSNNQTNNSTIEKYCYSNNSSNCSTYGGLYQWDEMMQYVTTEGTQGICPTGWHLPTDAEWKTIEMHLGMTQTEADAEGWRGTNEGSKLAGNAALWSNGTLEGDSDFGTSGFTGLPAGYRFTDSSFLNLSNTTGFWSSSENGSSAWSRLLTFNNTQAYRGYYGQTFGFSVRCLKD